VLNHVYFEHVKETFSIAIRELLVSLSKYINTKLNGSSKGARLGFSTEKEIFNICLKLFTTQLSIP
jgi:hypothetical protein